MLSVEQTWTYTAAVLESRILSLLELARSSELEVFFSRRWMTVTKLLGVASKLRGCFFEAMSSAGDIFLDRSPVVADCVQDAQSCHRARSLGVATSLSFGVEKKRARDACSALGRGACALKPWVKVEVEDFLQGRAHSTQSSTGESGGMAWVEVPTPVALLGGLMVMALSAHYMTARSKTG